MNSEAPATAAPFCPDAGRNWAARLFARPVTHAIIGALILAVDSRSGPFLLIPNVFALPVALAAWLSSTRWAYTLAVVLPVARLFVAEVRPGSTLLLDVGNAAIRVGVLVAVAFLVGRVAKQAAELEKRFTGLVTMCAWSRTIQYEGEWMSFEQYLKQRFGILTSHTISPVEAEKVLAETRVGKRQPPAETLATVVQHRSDAA